ncbi:hypothetical protein D9619_013199 [Psilocybe cf. subviscida]|uniref:Uncharacterized protein n=1 Tax=Psilocybe cf. subviscida TaxID=2480587 RepID=A0A8H5B6P2_9AGAR|nr:hypothetical protein D9619_013199 [Psilocybe cf. subviscida]
MSGRGRATGATRRGMDRSGRRRPGGNSGTSGTPTSALNTGGSSPPGANAGAPGSDSDPERETQRQRQREAELTVIEVDAIFSAHSDGLMVILRRAI